MDILKDFGVNPLLLIAQIVNFLVILFILKRFMYKPILSIIKKREDEIKKGIGDSEKAEKSLRDAQEKEKQILQKAQLKAEKIIGDAKLQADDVKAKIGEQTKKETQRMLMEARQTITQETKDAEERLTQKIGLIAIGLLEKSLAGIFGEKEQKVILKKASLELEKRSEAA